MRLSVAAVCLALSASMACSHSTVRRDDLVIGSTTSTATATSGPRIPTPPVLTDTAPMLLPEDEPAPGPIDYSVDGVVDTGIAPPDGRPYGPSIPFSTDIAVPDDMVYILVLGSDARPGEDLRTTRADSIHIVAVNPRTGGGTIVGIPRDAYVEVPGVGFDKINSALAYGGPVLMAETVRLLTGLPIDFYVLTGFDGFISMVDELGGVHAPVAHLMDDSASGARFEPGWHEFSGGEALAFSRNRKDTPNGDFSRSENQGELLRSGLAKLRSEVGDDEGVKQWIAVLVRHADLDMPPNRLLELAVTARLLDVDRVQNVVVPGSVGYAGPASVVFLGDGAAQIFVDLRDDATIGAAPPDASPPAATSTSPSSSTGGPGPGSQPPAPPPPPEPSTSSSTAPDESTTTSTGPPAPPVPSLP